MKCVKVRVTLGEKNFFINKANYHKVKLNDYARSLLIGVDKNRFIKPRSRIKLESLLAMMKGTVRDLRNLGHNVDYYLPRIDSLELATLLEFQIKREPIEFIADNKSAMLHLHFFTAEIEQIDRQARLNNQSRNDYIRGTLKYRDLPDYQFAEVSDEVMTKLRNIWSELRDFKSSVVFGTRDL
jgi:hypothetical protein